VPMQPLKASSKRGADVSGNQIATKGEESNSSSSSADRTANAVTPDSTDTPQSSFLTIRTRPWKSKSRAIKPLPTQPEDAELNMENRAPNRRGSPSSFARERMREIADNNAPFDDPDKARPKCKTQSEPSEPLGSYLLMVVLIQLQ
jgi:hypothetical protein